MQEIKTININLGKINLKRVKSLISDLEFKGKSTIEKSSYLDFKDNNYKESESVLTDLFGEIYPKITIFLNSLYEKYKYLITEDNFKSFMQEIKTFSDNYKYKIVDNRKTKEELLKQREENEQYQREREQEQKKQEEETHKKGLLTKSEKINLGTKEIAKRIREQLKNKFNGCKFSVSIERYSGGSSISVYLMESNIKVVEDYKNLTEEQKFKYLQDGRTEENLKAMQEGGHYQLNQYTTKEEYKKDCWNNGVFLTEEGRNLLKEVCEIVNYYNYDDSDPMTDYYSVNFSFHLGIGKWDKKYIYNPKMEVKKETATEIKNDIEIKRNEEKNGIEEYFKEKPKTEVLQLLKDKGFRWGRYNKCWYKKYTEGIEQEIKSFLGVA